MQRAKEQIFVERDKAATINIKLIAIILLFSIIAGTTLAFGAVEAWSIALLGFATIGLFILWTARCVIDRKILINVPLTVLPIAALLLYGGFQTLPLISIRPMLEGANRISMDTEATRLALEVGFMLLLITIISAGMLRSSRAINLFVHFTIAFGFLLSMFGLLQHLTWNGKYFWLIQPTSPPTFPFGSFVNHNHFAGFVEMIVPLALALALCEVVRGEFVLMSGFSVIIMGTAVIVSGSRGGMLSLFCGMLLTLILCIRRTPGAHRKDTFMPRTTSHIAGVPTFIYKITATALIFIIIAAGVLWVSSDSVIKRIERLDFAAKERSANPSKESFYQSRGFIWRDTKRMIMDNPILGVGLGAYATAYPIYSRSDGTIMVAQAHNDYLQLWADCGIIGVLLVTIFIALLLRASSKALHKADQKMKAIAIGCIGGIFAITVHSIFDFNLQIPSNALLFLLLTVVLSNIASHTDAKTL